MAWGPLAEMLKSIKTSEGKLVRFDRSGSTEEIEVDEILVGAGRVPNVEELNLEAVGVNYEAGRGPRGAGQ